MITDVAEPLMLAVIYRKTTAAIELLGNALGIPLHRAPVCVDEAVKAA